MHVIVFGLFAASILVMLGWFMQNALKRPSRGAHFVYDKHGRPVRQ